MATKFSNLFLYQLLKNIEGHTFKIVLMASGFVFNEDTHHGWADISASELANGNGYTTGGQTLASVAAAVDDVNNKGKLTAADVSWTASGGSIGPTPGAIIYDDTDTGDLIVGYCDFNGNKTVTDGNPLQVTNIECKLES